MSTEEVRYNEGGWYEIDGHESYCGSDDPRYLRALLLTGPGDRERIRLVLNFVERNTPALVRRFRDWRWSA